MLEKFQELKLNLQIWYEDFMWKYGEEEKRAGTQQTGSSHEQAMKEGRNSPYTHPEEYDAFY